MNRHTSTWSRESSTCKFWLEPIELARSHGFSARELNVVRRAQPAHAVVNRLRKRSGDRTPEGDGGGRRSESAGLAQRRDVLICGDDATACDTVICLAQSIGLRGIYAGPIANAVAVEALTSVLITINRKFKVAGSGIRITGLG